MDPDACLARIMRAVADGDTEEYETAYCDLAEWITRGGFVPRAFRASLVREAFANGPDAFRKLVEETEH